MVSSVASIPYFSYLGQLQGNSSSSASNSSSSTPSNSTPTTASANGSSAVSSLLGNQSSGFSPEILSLLQSNSSGSFDPVSSLLGGTSTNNATTSLYTNLYDSVAAAALQKAQSIVPQTQQTASSASANNPANNIDNLISGLTQSSIAYNQTLLQNVQAAVTKITNITPLIA